MSNPPVADRGLENLTLGLSFPPVADDEQRSFTSPHLTALGVKSIRIGEDWANREPQPGQFNWGPLDKRIVWAEENQLSVLLTIQSTGADWACSDLQTPRSCVYKDLADFKRYIDSLFNRYPNRIDRIQFGNEWQSDFWFPGTAEEFVAASNIVYESVKQYSPETTFVLGGFTAISLRLLAACEGNLASFYDDDGNFYTSLEIAEICSSSDYPLFLQRINTVLSKAKYDLLDLHLYDDPENWPAMIDGFRNRADKPVLVSEFGGPNLYAEPYSEQYQAEKLKEYITVLDSMAISEAYYFKLVEGSQNKVHEKSGLIRLSDLGEKPAYLTFKSFSNPD